MCCHPNWRSGDDPKDLAARLRTNPRTLENWKQGRAKPNAQAAVLICLVERYPETLEQLADV